MMLILSVFSCKKDNEEEMEDEKEGVVINDDYLFNKASSEGFFYYQGQDVLLSPAGNSPHGAFKLSFNSIAQSVLGSDGKLPENTEFPDSSIILKEVYSGNELSILVPMMKLKGHEKSGSNWLWGEYKPNGDVVYSIENKGGSCISCHSIDPHRDLTRSFDLH